MEKKAKKAKKVGQARKTTIYSVLSVDCTADWPLDAAVVGSWKDKETAVRECADYMIERINLRPDIRYAMFHDINHRNLVGEVAAASGVAPRSVRSLFKYDTDVNWKMNKRMEDAVRKVLREALAASPDYAIIPEEDGDVGADMFVFEIEENQLEA